MLGGSMAAAKELSLWTDMDGRVQDVLPHGGETSRRV
jgi:hypothetical protein